MRAAIFLPLLALSVSASLNVRHGDDENMDMETDHEHEHEHGNGHDATTHSFLTAVPEVATWTASSSAVAQSASVPKHTPHNPHDHHSHAPVKDKLDDADIHYWHKFPPTYMDADFRLTNDSVIFGEDLPADWPGETPSHPGLMIAHVASMIAAYFAILPISKSSLPPLWASSHRQGGY